MSFQTSLTCFLLLNTEKNDILKNVDNQTAFSFHPSQWEPNNILQNIIFIEWKKNIGRNVVTKPFKFPLISSVSLAHTLEVNGTRNVRLQIFIFLYLMCSTEERMSYRF